MQHNFLVRPVAALMRRLRLRSKLALVATAALWPLPLLWLMPELSLMVAPVAAVLMVWLLWGLDASLRTDLRQIIDVMEQTTSGNLRASLRVHGRDELADLTRLLDRMTGSLSAMVAEVRSNSALVAHAGQSLASGNRDLADRTEQQAANLEQTAASVQELTGTVARVRQSLQHRCLHDPDFWTLVGMIEVDAFEAAAAGRMRQRRCATPGM